MDVDNPVVTLCVRGMEQEGAGRPEQARELFEQAWESSADDYERCVWTTATAPRSAVP